MFPLLLLAVAVLLLAAGLTLMIRGCLRTTVRTALTGWAVCVVGVVPLMFALSGFAADHHTRLGAAVHAQYGATVLGSQHADGSYTLRLADGTQRTCRVTGDLRHPQVACEVPLPRLAR